MSENRPAAIVARPADREHEGWDDPARGDARWLTFFSAERTPTSAMCAGLMEVPPHGGTLAAHRHTQPELYFCVEGEGVATVEGEAIPLTPGTSVFIPGDAEHAVRNDGMAVLRIFYVFPTDRFAEVRYEFSPIPNGEN